MVNSLDCFCFVTIDGVKAGFLKSSHYQNVEGVLQDLNKINFDIFGEFMLVLQQALLYWVGGRC